MISRRLASRGLIAAAVALVLTAGVSGCAAWREGATEAAYPPVGQFVTLADGRRVHALVTGEGPDLVLIHGASGNLRDFSFDLIGRLSDRYRVIAFDRPGMGYTDRAAARYDAVFSTRAESPAEQAAMLREAAGLLGADRPLVLGHSYGGAVALAWALDAPDGVAGVIDLAGATMPWPGGLGLQYDLTGSTLGGAVVPPLLSAFAPQSVVDATLTAIFAPDPVPPGYGAHVGAGLALRRDSFRANARQVSTLRPHVVAMEALYPTLTMPVEIVHGDADTIVPLDIHSARLAALIPGAALTVLPGVGHMPHHADPDAVVAAIDRAAARAGLR